ncbi:MAG: MMPL family transporter [Bacteroidetes bacterium]|nr:MMPL family transporter [Bacteroidota bacterium]
MFRRISSIILRNRRLLLVVIGCLTIFFGFMATKIQLSYDFAKILPADDPFFKEYEKFKETFGEDGTVMVIGIQDSNFYQIQKFNGWLKLGRDIKSIDGIEAVVSVAEIYDIVVNADKKKFEIKPLVTEALKNQDELDVVKANIDRLTFYKGFIISDDGNSTLMAITFDKKQLNTKSRIEIVNQIVSQAEAFGAANNIKLHISGMPFIRTAITGKVAREMQLFLILAVVVCSIILWVFFRSFKVVIFSVIVVLVGVIWSIGTIAIFGYKITILTALIPPLIIVIGIPNSILLLNKYHIEFQRHGNKIKALARMIERIGLTTFLANLTTAIGFGVFYFTHSRILMEFGLIAAINVMATYLIALILVPIVFSFLPEPEVKHVKHLQAPRLNKVLEFIDRLVSRHHRSVFVVVGILIVISLYGVTKITTVGYVVDDLPKNDPVYIDMRFFEKNFKGVLPLEITVDTRSPGKALDPVNLQKINRLEKMLTKYSEFSKPIAIVDGIKFSYQAYRGGDSKYHILPGTLDLADMASFLKGDSANKANSFRSFLDSSRQVTRISIQMADIGSLKMKVLIDEIRPRIDSIFNPTEYTTSITGNSLIFMKGNDYLFKNLMESIILAIFLISIIMFLLFMSFRMITVSILPSLIPLLITAGIMGFFQIPLKPSTILIFSIAFGIASDGTIYFLTKYRLELRHNPLSISKAVSLTIRETGVSMIYTAIILFFGFFIFSASSFGGTASLGVLISITLLVAMASNLILLPAFLIALERRIATKAFLQEPLIQTFDEEEDIEQDDLIIRKIDFAADDQEYYKD